ncbi:MAG: hypothetical protein WC533_04070 [Candidatus Pacearchaeota archaeon]
MKVLVVFYSRNKHTRYIAEKISNILKCDIDEVVDLKERSRRISGWAISGWDAVRKNSTKIKILKNPKDYGLVIIGTPNWVGNITPAVRTYLTQHKLEKVAFFCTFGGNEGQIYNTMEKLSAKPIAILGIKDKEIRSKETESKIKEFCDSLKKIK